MATYANVWSGGLALSSGAPAAGVGVSVYNLFTGTLATLYAEPTALPYTMAGAATVPNPVTTDSSGNLRFWAAPGQYQLKMGSTAIAEIAIPDDPNDVGAGAGGTYSAGSGITLIGSTFSLTSPVTIAHGGTGVTSSSVFNAIAYNGGALTDVTIQAAIAACQAAGGGTVLIPAGIWVLSAALLVTGTGIQLQGVGAATILQVGSGATGAGLKFGSSGAAATDCRVSNLQFQQASSTTLSNPARDAIQIINATRTVIMDVKGLFQNGSVVNVVPSSTGSVTDISMMRVNATSCLTGFTFSDGGLGGLHQSLNAKVSACSAATLSGNAFTFSNVADVVISDAIATDSGTSGSGISIIGGCASLWFVNCDVQASNSGAGFYAMRFSGSSGTTLNPGLITVVGGTLAEGNSVVSIETSVALISFIGVRFNGMGVAASGVLVAAGPVRFVGCSFDSMTTADINVTAATADVVISNCSFNSTSATNSLVVPATNLVRVTDNDFTLGARPVANTPQYAWGNNGGPSNSVTVAAGAQQLTPTAVWTTSATASPGNYVPVDATGSAVNVTLPSAPTDKSRIGVKMIAVAGTNTVSVLCSGSDTFDSTTGATSLSLSMLDQAVLLQYDAPHATWYVQANELPLSQLDARYGAPVATGIPVGGQGAYANIVTSTSVALTANTWTLIPNSPSITLPNDGNTYRVECSFPGAQISVTGDAQVGIGTSPSAILAAVYEDLLTANNPVNIGPVVVQNIVGQGQVINMYGYSAGAATLTILAFSP